MMVLSVAVPLAPPFLDELARVALFLCMLSVLVVLHELGHFVLARLNGVRVNDFAVGFGPTLLKWTSPRSGTNYRLNLFPIGGYCAMQGEDGRTNEAEQQRQFRDYPTAASDNFQSKSPWRRLAIIAAGPVANFIVAFFILVLGAALVGAPSGPLSTSIGPLIQGSPGDRAGLQIGDRITAIDGSPVRDGLQMVDRIHGSAGKPLHLTIDRRGTTLHITVTPQRQAIGGKSVGIIGFATQSVYERVGVGQAIAFGSQRFVDLIAQNVLGLGALIVHPHSALAQVSGPIGIGRVASEAQDLGWGPYLQLAAIISVALGIFNFLPIPALDGGRGIFIIAEILRGRPVDPEKEALVHATGFALLMVLMVFVAYHDIATIVTSKGAL
jgi:regulator of sigma E protease